jgi:hypothetical protein
MWFFNSLKSRICGLVVAMGLLSSMASASTVATFLSVTPNGSDFDFKYAISLTTRMSVGVVPVADFFEIVDVLGYKGAAWYPLFGIVGPNWTVGITAVNSVPTNGIPASFTYLPDAAGIPNVLVTYVAGPNITNASAVDMPLGTLVITSTLNEVAPGWMVGSDTQILPGGRLNGSNFTACPVPIPTPAAMWSGMALLGLIGAAKLRKSL